ncbi:MAG: hypothetical protein HYW25_03720 [Candidatus Aenigmarchaeota archaeon]|nr:hypothetical protein [Candidatus Aenigmarchaeota archaeon]
MNEPGYGIGSCMNGHHIALFDTSALNIPEVRRKDHQAYMHVLGRVAREDSRFFVTADTLREAEHLARQFEGSPAHGYVSDLVETIRGGKTRLPEDLIRSVEEGYRSDRMARLREDYGLLGTDRFLLSLAAEAARLYGFRVAVFSNDIRLSNSVVHLADAERLTVDCYSQVYQLSDEELMRSRRSVHSKEIRRRTLRPMRKFRRWLHQHNCRMCWDEFAEQAHASLSEAASPEVAQKA